jgi:hypothetical protein
MLTLIKYPIASLTAVVVLYLWFRAAMWYLRHKHELREKSGIGLVLLEIGLAPGLLLDIIVNWTIGLSLGWVYCLTLSDKLCYIRKNGSAWRWRKRFADWVCDDVLNQWDPTHHHC